MLILCYHTVHDATYMIKTPTESTSVDMTSAARPPLEQAQMQGGLLPDKEKIFVVKRFWQFIGIQIPARVLVNVAAEIIRIVAILQ